MVIEQTLNRFFGNDLKHGRGVTPSVVAQYLLAMPSAFDIMEGLETYCGVLSATSEQHVDLSKSRINKDQNDIQHFLFWLNEHSPFEYRTSLMSLSTGIIGGHNINCRLAVEKGLRGMALMVDKNAANVSLSAAFKVKNLAAAQHAININDEHFVTVDTLLLFQWISVLFQGNTELTRNALTYELSPFPLSLFDEQGLMRKTPKSQLYKMFRPFIQSESLLSSCTYVVDGGWLLHSVLWPHSKTYGDIFHVYMSYVVKHFGTNATIIFNGYNNELIGVKSYERYRRREKCVAHDVEIAKDKLVILSQSKFLSNVANKYKFVNLLSTFLKRHNIRTEIATEDADTLIVRTTIEMNQSSNRPVAIVGNDVDLLILLIGLAGNTDDILFRKVTSGEKKYVSYSTSYDRHLQPFILFAHAFAGCDTTSAMYKKGKKTAVSILKKNEHLQEVIKIFYQPDKTIDEIYSAAEQFIVHLYKIDDQSDISVAELRYKNFASSVTNVKKEISLAVLPPTEAALREHSKRVYLQIQTWLGHDMNPEEWGWRRTNCMMLPIMTTKPPGPKELLEMVNIRNKVSYCTACDVHKFAVKINMILELKVSRWITYIIKLSVR